MSITQLSYFTSNSYNIIIVIIAFIAFIAFIAIIAIIAIIVIIVIIAKGCVAEVRTNRILTCLRIIIFRRATHLLPSYF